ncbi:hypothetical protein [Cellulomonas xiejunii]|uniref:DUF1795 domain-containing protein n=1 Tax=Cellulomonas xiejunii TaxID=2968083 RepID=A0ABY5KK78_9CELL|nr:hypothetical protein [Cellulomonas xiejunii]MCC2312718.1 hypothetical protein [Cellulomonas xiejunii]MCC2320412.1 hypothetical protein [Cellulomonas xiejunii]UUI70709.1 hypothetical protein NP048_13005 [Cellulomonas xiejunii]
MTKEMPLTFTRGATLVGTLVLGALLTSCGTTGPAEPDVPDGWTTHTVGDVTFSTPGTWEVDESEGALVVRRGSDATDAMASVVLVPEPRPLQVEADAVFASMVAATGAKKVADGPVEKSGASEAVQLEYVGDQPRADGSGTFAARSRWLFMTLEDGSGLIAAVTAPEEQFDEELETVLESVTLP